MKNHSTSIRRPFRASDFFCMPAPRLRGPTDRLPLGYALMAPTEPLPLRGFFKMIFHFFSIILKKKFKSISSAFDPAAGGNFFDKITGNPFFSEEKARDFPEFLFLLLIFPEM